MGMSVKIFREAGASLNRTPTPKWQQIGLHEKKSFSTTKETMAELDNHRVGENLPTMIQTRYYYPEFTKDCRN